MMTALFQSISRRTVLLATLFAPGGMAHAADLLFPIQTDTYMDSQTPTTNYGASGSVKALINNNVSSDGSACRGLFQFPSEAGLQDIRKLAQAQVCFYVFKDQTAGRNVTLYPLTHAFAEGSGTGDGASWNTHDGTNAWTTAGGDFDASHPVVGTRGADGFFRWDITSLLADATTRSNLLNYGALLQIDEIPVPTNGTPRAPFTSSDGAAAERPHVQWTLAAPFSFPIASDTYLDNRSSNVSKNYGAANTVKVLINNNVTGDGSVSRGLFQLPPELGLYAPGTISEAKLYFYVWQDNTTNLNLTLYPLTQSFAEGTGNGTAPANGATWNTYDGTNAWATAGGDFDTNYPVVGVKEEILDPDLHDRFFSWDITALLTNEIARSNLLAHGAILQIDEVPVPTEGMPRAPLTSSDDLSYAAAYRPHLDIKVRLQTPEIPQVAIADGRMTMDIAGCTPLVTNRIERTLDLQQANGWTFVTNLVATGSDTNWTEVLQPEWTNAFYRIVALP
jgi:hypothetical protein